jgi:hypothetical protein
MKLTEEEKKLIVEALQSQKNNKTYIENRDKYDKIKKLIDKIIENQGE